MPEADVLAVFALKTVPLNSIPEPAVYVVLVSETVSVAFVTPVT